MKVHVKVMMAAMLVLAVVAVRFPGAAPATWTGKISDSMCGADHGAKGGTMAKDHDCTASCVKGGSKYVFVNDKDKKIYKIGNQDYAGLTIHGGHSVELTGELKDDTITVTKIVMPKAK
jgi:hypothetical protein